MTLSDLVGLYATQRDIQPGTIEQYSYVVQSFTRHLGNDPDLTAITSEQINAWLIALQSRLSPHTVRTRRATLVTLLNHARRLQIAEQQFVIRRIKTGDSLFQTLTSEQVGALRQRCDKLRGKWGRLTIAGYLRTFIDATLETALRRSDLHFLLVRDIHRQPLQLIQRKTGHRRFAVFSLSLITRILLWHDGQSSHIWPALNRRVIPQRLHELGVQIGVPRLTHTLLRKTAITDVERQQPGSGWIFAGHRGPETTFRWYTDKEQQYLGLPKPRF